ncbi:MAG: hypothetical protein ACR2FY_09790 [Pirellulaceae bacterium]
MRLRIVFCLVLVFGSVVSVCSKGEDEKLKKELNAMESLDNRLEGLGEQFNCWFTIERRGNPTERTLASMRVNVGTQAKSRESLVDALKSELNDALIFVDALHPQVVHIVDNSLEKVGTYSMVQKTTVKFEGVLADLPVKIGESIKGIDTRRGGSNTDAYNDHVTKVRIEAKAKSVREILTDAVPIEKYSRVLWVAETFQEGEQTKTWIQFTGPAESTTK